MTKTTTDGINLDLVDQLLLYHRLKSRAVMESVREWIAEKFDKRAV